MRMNKVAALLLLFMVATGAVAQTEDCNKNSSISHEAVKSKNYHDAYIPWKYVMENCPTLRYYTYTDGRSILTAFLQENKDRNSAEYKKYFDELMAMHDQKIKYLPEFRSKVPSVGSSIGVKAIDYLMFAPSVDANVAYSWLKEAIDSEKANSQSAILNYFLDMSLAKLKNDQEHREQFFQDYLTAADYADDAVMLETDSAKKETLRHVKDNIEAMFINSGTADCDALQTLFGPKVEAAQTDSNYLKKAIGIMKVMRCTESEAYFQASYYMYKIHPTADAAMGCGYMAYKKGDYDEAVKYFNEALELENNPEKKAQIAYAGGAALLSMKRYAQAKASLLRAIQFRPSYGDAYILLAQTYASNPNWSDEPALNKCTYYVVIDKLQRARSVDPKVAARAQELIGTYARYVPKTEDLFMLGIKDGDTVEVKGWIGETTRIRKL
ncbi:MAG: tetratricopeptide repeat protein [Prevotellaceae bacterium]|nr:tetratricopeptide repeat protein [Prevotellaceae bacterium]